MYLAQEKLSTCVPQGNVLGPMLFTTNFNDFPISTNHDIILFADDSTVVVTGYELKLHRKRI